MLHGLMAVMLLWVLGGVLTATIDEKDRGKIVVLTVSQLILVFLIGWILASFVCGVS